MFRSGNSIFRTVVPVFILLTVLCVAGTASAETHYKLDNGMEVVLRENHSAPLAASIIFVKSGSKFESQYENGITHFLEHLLFDGTTHLGRLELDQSVRDLGGYINAFTRKELTAYLCLLPSQYVEYGLAVQADMLFCSTIPEDELAKERKVVIEEINSGADYPGAAAEKFYTAKAFAGTPYARPVLGYAPFIENIPRAALIDYWRRNYVPAKMSMLVVGDFQTDSMKAMIQRVFGGIKNPTDMTTEQADLIFNATIEGQNRFDTVAAVPSTYIDFSFNAPKIDHADFFAVDLLTQYLTMDEISPLWLALKGGAEPLASEVSIGLVPREEFSRVEVSIISEVAENRDRIVDTVLHVLKTLSTYQVDADAIEGLKVSARCEEIYNSEKLHYYGFLIAPLVAAGGWDFIGKYGDNLQAVTWDQCQQAAGRWFDDSAYVVTVVRPAGETEIAFTPETGGVDEIVAYFDSTEFPTHDLGKECDFTYPATDEVSFEIEDRAEYHQETLENGLTVIIKSSPDSRVFALNIIGKGRSVHESSGQAGITDLVNRCIEKGTTTRDAETLARDLAKIGAEVTLTDNPWIPFDDHYTTRRFSFMKFATIDEFAEEGFNLFSEMVLQPAFDPIQMEKVRGQMMGMLGRNAGSPSKVSRNLFYATLFEGKAYAEPVMGSPRSIGTITADDLKAHHAYIYAPENMILSIATSRTVEQVMGWVKDRFGSLSAGDREHKRAAPPAPVSGVKAAHQELDKEQIWVRLGGALPASAAQDYTSIAIASSILSNRLALNLREKQGLAYSVGAGYQFDRDFGWYYSSIGTSPETYQQAVDGIILEIEKLKLDDPTVAEIAKARNQIWGRLMRSKLMRVNQAYYQAVDIYLGRGLGYDQKLLDGLQTVTVASIRRACSLYFRTDDYVLATAGKKPGN